MNLLVGRLGSIKIAGLNFFDAVHPMFRFLIAYLATTLSGIAFATSISDFESWQLVEDPPHSGMVATLDGIGGKLGAITPPGPKTSALLCATGAVPSGTDIGFASVNGFDAASSNAGYFFDPADDFFVAIDFDISSTLSVGGGGIGFGIGEDIEGTDSAGVALAIVNGATSSFTTASRVANVDQPFSTIAAGFDSGRMFLEYQSLTGDVVVGLNPTLGASTPSVTTTIASVQDQWDDEPLLVSFFLRSQEVPSLLPALTSGSIEATFSNFEVLSGTPIAIPEPSTTLLAALALLASWRFPRQARG